MTCTSTRARSLSRGLSRSWQERRTRSRGRKLAFGLFGILGAVLIMAGPAAAQSVVKLGTSAPAPSANSADAACGASKYHAALSEIRASRYPAVKAAREDAGAPDASLPGRLIFNPAAVPRGGEARRALAAALRSWRPVRSVDWLPKVPMSQGVRPVSPSTTSTASSSTTCTRSVAPRRCRSTSAPRA